MKHSVEDMLDQLKPIAIALDEAIKMTPISNFIFIWKRIGRNN